MLNSRKTDLDINTATQAVEFVYGNLLEVSRIQMIFPLIVGFVFWGTVASWKIILWCIASCLIYLTRIGLTLLYRKRPATDINPTLWGQRFTATSLVSGVMWGYAAWLFYVPEAQTALVLLYVLIVGTAAGAVMISSYWMPGYLAYALPSVLLTALSLFINGDRNENVLGFMMCLLLLMLLSVAYKCREQAYESIRLRFENLDLIDRLAAAKERAEDASRAKTQFLASANHDLRQPVHALSLLSYSLKEELTTERGMTVYSQLNQTVSNLNSLLESLLDLSQLDSGALAVKPSIIYLPDLAGQLKSEFLSLCGQKQLEFRVRSLDAAVHTDGTLLLRLLRNLLTNAVRYTQSGGVLLAFRQQGQNIVIQIWDTGIGIKQEEQRDVFREFYQVSNKARNSNEGLGLGLAICQKIIELLDLSLTMRSVFGKGTVFTITLPKADARLHALSPARDTESHSILKNKKVLIIDDDLIGLGAISQVLSSVGMQTTLAQSAERAQELAEQSGTQDLIISDFRLSEDINGVTLIHQLQQLPEHRNTAALIITGDTAPDVISHIKASGIEYLHKPVNTGQLLSTIESALIRNTSKPDRQTVATMRA